MKKVLLEREYDSKIWSYKFIEDYPNGFDYADAQPDGRTDRMIYEANDKEVKRLREKQDGGAVIYTKKGLRVIQY